MNNCFKIEKKQTLQTLGTLLVFLVGLFFLTNNTQFGTTLKYNSYDWITGLCSFKSKTNSLDVVIIYLDETSHKDLGQPYNQPWDRSLHARLLNRITDDGAKGVVFDIVFSDPGPNTEADDSFAKAIRDNGHVILAADLVDNPTSVGMAIKTHERLLALPYEPFRKAAAGWGFAQLQPDEDFLIREHRHGTPDSEYVSLAWAANAAFGVKKPVQPIGTERWINYYNKPEQVPGVSYKIALNLPKGYFHDKVVFIGARPMTGQIRERKDEFRSPYSNWFREPVFMPAVDIHTLTFLNLTRGDWLRRLPPVIEWMIVLFGSLCFGCFLNRYSLPKATLVAGIGLICIIGGTVLLLILGRFWYPWLILIEVQAPLGLFTVIVLRSIEWVEQRRRYEQARKAADARIREQAALLDKAHDAIMVHNLEGKTTYWNPSAEQLYGWTAQEMSQQTADEMLFGSNLVTFEEAFRKTLSSGDWKGELQQTTKTGKKIIVDSRWSRICDENGIPQAIFVINSNITDRKKLESQLRQAQRTKTIGTLASGIVHDLNNILTPVLMISDMLQLHEVNAKRKEMLQAVKMSVERAAAMGRQILTFVRGCEGEMVPLQTKHIVRDLAFIIKDTFPKSISVEVVIDTDLFTIKGDATQIDQVLLNLCVNSRDAMPKGGNLKIEAKNVLAEQACQIPTLSKDSRPYILLRVCDSGTGIPPEIINSIFDPFFTTKEIGKGTGLGLSTVRGIVKNHNGYIHVESELGIGSVFSVYIPAIVGPLGPVIDEQPKIITGQGQLVLVVDEDPLIRAVIEMTLEQNNYRVLQAKDGKNAVQMFAQRAKEINIIILDTMMSGADGLTVMGCIKQIEPNVTIITLGGTAKDLPKESSLVAHLVKPFSAEQLLSVLNNGNHTGLDQN